VHGSILCGARGACIGPFAYVARGELLRPGCGWIARVDESMEALTVFAVALATALATGLGALPFVFVARPERRWLGVANSLASGFMLGASAGLLLEGSSFGVSRTLAGAAAGMFFVWICGGLIGHDREVHFGALAGADARRALLIVGIMTLHSFAEGVGVGVAFGVEQTLGVLIGLAIAIHNVPEGLAISLVLVPRGASPRSAAAWSVFSSLPQPLMAVPAFLFVGAFSSFLPVGLGFAAGAMVWLVAADLLPEALRTTKAATVVTTVVCSGFAMLAFVLLLL
jgi:ZIP family zinc transporter